MKVYVVSAPESIRGIYSTWAEYKEKVSGVKGARYQSVDDLDKAKALLAGGIVLPTGIWVFTDGNALGGVRVVVVEQRPDGRSGPPIADKARVERYDGQESATDIWSIAEDTGRLSCVGQGGVVEQT